MVIVMVIDVATGFFGSHLPINDFVYNSFLIVTLGSFGIAGVENIFSKK